MAVEWYGNGANSSSNLPWYSAGKTLSAFMMGIAQQDGYLSLQETSQNYLGENWSELAPDQEKNISVRNHLTMTTGLDYNVENNSCYHPVASMTKFSIGVDLWPPRINGIAQKEHGRSQPSAIFKYA